MPCDLSLYTYNANYIPRNPKIECLGEKSFKLSWEHPIADDIDGYKIYRAFTDEQIFHPVGQTQELYFTDIVPETQREYFYRITSLYQGS